MEAFCEIVRQVFGPEIGERAMSFLHHFRSIWQAVNPCLWCEDDVTVEIKRLVDEVDALFDAMLAKSVEMETKRGGLVEATAALARLPNEPGFKDAKSYKTALYRLFKKYPSADHFVWKG